MAEAILQVFFVCARALPIGSRAAHAVQIARAETHQRIVGCLHVVPVGPGSEAQIVHHDLGSGLLHDLHEGGLVVAGSVDHQPRTGALPPAVSSGRDLADDSP